MAPQRAKLHNKTGKLKTIRSTNGIEIPQMSTTAPSASTATASSSYLVDTSSELQLPCPSTADTEAERQFELELCWCIQQLETSLKSGKLNEKQTQDTEKNIKILKSPHHLLIKKRQLMRSTFGDYRAKMMEENKKLAMHAKNIKFDAKASPSKKSFFVKKSAFLTSGSDFKFNFSMDQIGHLKISETETTVDESVAKLEEDVTNPKETNPFKYVPSENSFKFNFNVLNNNNG